MSMSPVISVSSAKISRPVCANVAPRERLLATVAKIQARLCWLHGPPGSGKTTLAASYAARTSKPCVWVRLDSGDVDASLLMGTISAAFAANGLIDSSQLPDFKRDHLPNTATFIRLYFRSFFAAIHEAPLIVLDDVQEIATSGILTDLLLALLEESTSAAHILALSRTAPPDCLVRPLLSGNAVELEPSQLCLTIEETKCVLAQHGVTLDEATLRQLQRITSGWITGVVLYGRQMAGTSSKLDPGLLRTPKRINQYFSSEVFDRLDPTDQACLLKTAWLPVLTVDLIRPLADPTATLARLQQLADAALFVERYADPEPCFRYHPLFAQFLQSHADGHLPAAEITAIHYCSAQALQTFDRPHAALPLWLACGALQQAIKLIKNQAPRLVAGAGFRTLENWLEAIPPAVFATEPQLYYWRGLCTLQRDPEAARSDLSIAAQIFKKRGQRREWFSTLSQLSSSYFLEQANAPATAELLHEVERLAGDFDVLGDSDLQALVAVSVWMGMFLHRPDHTTLPLWEERLMRLLQSAIDPTVKIRIGMVLTKHYYFTGQYVKISPLKNLLHYDAAHPNLAPYAYLLWHLIGIAEAWIRGDTQVARSLHTAAIAYSGESGVQVLDLFAHCYTAIACLLDQDLEAGAALLAQVDKRLASARPMEVWNAYSLKAWHAYLSGNVQQSREYGRVALTAAQTMQAVAFEGLARVGLAYVELAVGTPRALNEQLQALDALERRGGGPLLTFQRLLLQALLTQREDASEDSRRALQLAFSHGCRYGFYHFIWACPEPLAQLCATALKHGVEPDYAVKLARLRRLAPPPQAIDLCAWPWRLRVYALGRWLLEKDGSPLVDSKGKVPQRPLALLKSLIAMGGKEVLVQRIADELWPDADGDNARKSFETTLYRLRKLLDCPEALLLQDGRLSLNRALCWIDAYHVDRCVDAILDGDGGSLCNPLDDIAAFYQGPFLPGDDLPSLLRCRDRLAQRIRLALQQVVDRSIADRKPIAGDERIIDIQFKLTG